MKLSMPGLSLLFLLGACGGPGDAAVGQAAPPASLYQDAVDHPDRLADDLERDAARQPEAVLRFLEIRPGMTVLDLFSGGGYYSELLARVVGDDGKVVAHSNKAYEGIAGEQTAARYGDDRLANVEMLMAENNAWNFSRAEFDAILMVLSYHDIYYVNAKDGWPKIDGPALLAAIYQAAKPGAVFGIVDHAAAAGSPRETGGTTHRIDPAIVIRDVEAAGFKLEEQSDALRNLKDDYSRNVFEPDLRGKTDRFILRFRKPE